MSLKSFIALPYAKWMSARLMRAAMDPVAAQRRVLEQLISGGSRTEFGKEHKLDQVRDDASLKQAVPLRDYEAFRPYIDRIVAGERDVLWPGQPLYLCKTSGTTSGAKYIPITRESLPNHISSARNALLAYIAHSGKSNFLDGRMIFLQGSPVLDTKGAIPTGRLSGIVANHVPAYLRKNRLPSFAVNSIGDWEMKVAAIVEETMREDMRLISGIPAWVQMYFEQLLARSGKRNVRELFPNFSLFVYGGVNYEPYRSRMETLIGGAVDSVEIFPASEGFIAYQDRSGEEGLLLVVENGIYFEFIATEAQQMKLQGQINKLQDTRHKLQVSSRRLSLADVQLGVDYALVLHTNAGLWGYELGDTVRFVSLSPPRIVVTGRTKQFTSAFGEHVIAEEVEGALKDAMREVPCEVSEFTVAPQTSPPNGGLPYHEWFIEFAASPADPSRFASVLDAALQKRNTYYKDLITGKVLRPLVITPIARAGFATCMKSRGMNDAQSKVPRLANDRKFVEGLG